MSSSFSPNVVKYMGFSRIFEIFIIAPALEDESSFVIIIPSIPIALLKISAWLFVFFPIVESITSIFDN